MIMNFLGSIETEVIAQEKNYEIIIKHCVCFKNNSKFCFVEEKIVYEMTFNKPIENIVIDL